jgi:hypothetical protein
LSDTFSENKAESGGVFANSSSHSREEERKSELGEEILLSIKLAMRRKPARKFLPKIIFSDFDQPP